MEGLKLNGPFFILGSSSKSRPVVPEGNQISGPGSPFPIQRLREPPISLSAISAFVSNNTYTGNLPLAPFEPVQTCLQDVSRLNCDAMGEPLLCGVAQTNANDHWVASCHHGREDDDAGVGDQSVNAKLCRYKDGRVTGRLGALQGATEIINNLYASG